MGVLQGLMTISPVTSLGLVVTYCFLVLVYPMGFVDNLRLRKRAISRPGDLLSLACDTAAIAHLIIQGATVCFLLRGETCFTVVGDWFVSYDSVAWIQLVLAFIVGAEAAIHRLPRRGVQCAVMLLVSCPALIMAGGLAPYLELLSAAGMVVMTNAFIARQRSFINSIPNAVSIEGAVDRMPMGIVYIRDDGRVLYLNEAMRSCLRELDCPTDAGDLGELWDLLVLKDAKLVGYRDVTIDLKGDGRTWWTFAREHGTLGKDPVTIITAADISEQVNLYAEVSDANRMLEATAVQLKLAVQEAEKVARVDVKLKVGRRVHDTLGAWLSIISRNLEEGSYDPATLERVRLGVAGALADLRTPLHVSPSQVLDAVIRSFAQARMSIVIQGEFPGDVDLAFVMVDVIRECATNALAHADATSATATIHHLPDGTYVLMVANDGTPPNPDQPTVEGQGIPGMRRSVEASGGMLGIDTDGHWIVRAIWPPKER